MKKILRNAFVLAGVLLYFSHLAEVNPYFPLFLFLFGPPLIFTYAVDRIDFSKAILFLKISLKYGLVLSINLYKSLKFNLVQYRQVVSRRMSEY